MEQPVRSRLAEGGADLLMECDEEEQEVWPRRDEGERPIRDQRLFSAAPEAVVRAVAIPVQQVSSCTQNQHAAPAKSSGSRLSFKLNGRLVALQPGGAELKLRSHPRGSASGFTSVHVPVTLTLHSPAGTHQVSTAPPPEADPTPIITDVVSGEAAQRVLNHHNFKSSPPRAPQTAPSPERPTAQRPPRPLPKGQRGPVSPPACLLCSTQFRLVTELRGFMCLCSPALAQSLKLLKKRRRRRSQWRRSRDKKTPQVVSPPPRTHRPPSPAPPSSTCSPQPARSGPPPDPVQGKLVIMVQDFYYGSAPGESAIESAAEGNLGGAYRCIHCPKTLCNNIELMSHMSQHAASLQDGPTDAASSCPHCFRPFLSPRRLQCHLEAVHSHSESTAKCKICELDFSSEPDFLWHMKRTHKPGEMPYACQVCGFRSSFFSVLWTHFEQLHAHTRHLLCQYCLRVLHSPTCYQQHFTRHQKKHLFSCDKCRLHFLFVKELNEHKLLHHRTHVRPPQLSGLKPGTKVTVRTYSGGGGSEDEHRWTRACKVVDVDPPPPMQEAPRRKPVESLGALLCSLDQDSELAAGPHRCVECLSSFQDFRSHFPSLVCCSLCSFTTCCSTSYANHMITHHSSCRMTHQFCSIFRSDFRSSEPLRCFSCAFSTCSGDVMANHLTGERRHGCTMATPTEPSANGTKDTQLTGCVASPLGAGAFVPIHLLPSSQSSTQLSVKPLTTPSPLSSPPVMTIKVLGPRPQPGQGPVSPLSDSQLAAVLSFLCHGLGPASSRHRTAPPTLRSWVGQQERHLSGVTWFWRTDKLAEWVLSRREQQLSVSEDVLLQTARRVLGEDSQQRDRYCWTVHFLLRHQLSVEPPNPDQNHRRRGRLPKSFQEHSCTFRQLLSAQLRDKAPGLVGSMDEFSIFVDLNKFLVQDPSALQLSGSPEDKPVFEVVLSALSDGTFLPPLLVFRGTPSQVPEGFPDNVLLEARPDGPSDQDCQRVWMDQVWRPRVDSQRESVLIVDIHRGHLTDDFRNSLSSMSTSVSFIPAGCSSRLQPLDVCVTPLLRDFLQARWTQLVSQGGLEGLGVDQLALTLACWLSEVTSMLNSETDVLRRSFSSVCDLQEEDARGGAAQMIQTLSEALVQPLDSSDPPPDPGPGLELLLVMEEEQKEEEEEQKEEVLVERPSALRLLFEADSDQDTFHGFHDD